MNIALCDDQRELLGVYESWILNVSKEHGIPVEITCYESGEALLFAAEDRARCPDLIYLDINMPGTDGISVAETLRQMHQPVEIVFLTVSREHWNTAFDVGAVNYLVKDQLTDERFERTFLQATERVQERREETILLSCVGQTRNIRVRDIFYFEVQRNIMVVHYAVGGQAKKFEFYSTMARVEELLWEKGFIRIHRSFLAARKYIESACFTSVRMLDGTELPVGRSYYTGMLNALKEKLE